MEFWMHGSIRDFSVKRANFKSLSSTSAELSIKICHRFCLTILQVIEKEGELASVVNAVR